CGIRKNTFTGEGWVIKKKSKKEKEDAMAKKKAAAFNRQCKELGLEIFQSDKACQQCVAKCLDDRMRGVCLAPPGLTGLIGGGIQTAQELVLPYDALF
ncbi:hypothetical protein RhiirA4_485009, partial [Rhizophagus irregularis]